MLPLEMFDFLSNGPLRTLAAFRESLRYDLPGRAARMPGSAVIEVSGAGHALHYSHPEQVAQAVRRLAAR